MENIELAENDQEVLGEDGEEVTTFWVLKTPLRLLFDTQEEAIEYALGNILPGQDIEVWEVEDHVGDCPTSFLEIICVDGESYGAFNYNDGSCDDSFLVHNRSEVLLERKRRSNSIHGPMAVSALCRVVGDELPVEDYVLAVVQYMRAVCGLDVEPGESYEALGVSYDTFEEIKNIMGGRA